MDNKLRNYYLESQVNNASPGQLLIMLYDCLIECAETAETEISAHDTRENPAAASHAVTRCINILTELNTCLRHNVEPTLCTTLSDLYSFFMKEFSLAFEARNPKKISAILPLIRDLRGAWFQADRRANQFQPEAFAAA